MQYHFGYAAVRRHGQVAVLAAKVWGLPEGDMKSAERRTVPLGCRLQRQCL